MVYQRVRILDIAREPRDKAEAQAVLSAGKATVVDIPSGKESLNEVVGLPDFLTKLSDLLVCFPKLLFQ